MRRNPIDNVCGFCMGFLSDVDEREEKRRIFQYDSDIAIIGGRRCSNPRKKDIVDYNNMEINTKILQKYKERENMG